MDYMWLGLGIAGLIASLVIYHQADARDALYEVGLIGYVMSWVVLVYGTWQVLR